MVVHIHNLAEVVACNPAEVAAYNLAVAAAYNPVVGADSLAEVAAYSPAVVSSPGHILPWVVRQMDRNRGLWVTEVCPVPPE
jgi:hypothetical protein